MNTSSLISEPAYTEKLEFIERRLEHKDVSTYIFHPANPVSFSAGAYAHIRMLNMPEGTRRVHELSFASSPDISELWFGVDQRSGSPYQQALLSLRPGDCVELFKIRSHMTWPPSLKDVVMVAGGVGVAPFRSMLLDAQKQGFSITTTLVQVSSDSFLYANELQALVNEHHTINRIQLIETLQQIVSMHPEAHYYIAGSKDFVLSVANELTSLNIKSIESDEFKGLLAE